ncbi:hypothetical protein HZP82_04540 [Elizabethkingia anophelis]|nr:hypothetical protein [Elizabethkingia anophelis]MCT4104530.1 hypothetical protein [Elizabethkingia anophelis]
MKTKYIAVPVSERRPKDTNDVIVIDEHGQSGEAFFRKSEKWCVYNRDAVNGRIEFWLEEKEDHSEEMLFLLNRVVSFTSLGEKVPDFLTHEIEALLNEINNGKI